MSKTPPYDPSRFAWELKATGDYATDGKRILRWVGTHWATQDDHEMEREAAAWLARTEWPSSAMNARAAYATSMLHLPKLHESDAAIVLIPVLNGYLRVEDGVVTLKPHDKALGIRYVLKCDYDPLAPEPREFMGFLNCVLPTPDVQARVQEYVGYTLLPDTRFQRAQFWVGAGANGKGVLANIVQALHSRTAAVQLDALDGFRLAGLLGASLVYCDEAPQRGINEQTMKSLIAGELMQIDRKYRDPIDARCTGKWVILSNHIPAVTDQSHGFWRRFDLVPFDVTIAPDERDPLLASRIITHELCGVLNWALDGLKRLLARGRFEDRLPTPMLALLEGAKRETNSVAAWADEQGIGVMTITETSTTKVYDHYVSWCKGNGMTQLASPRFWKRLQDVLGKAVVRSRMETSAGRIRTCNVELPEPA